MVKLVPFLLLAFLAPRAYAAGHAEHGSGHNATAAEFQTSCVTPLPFSPEFCATPPVVSEIDLPSYAKGRWYQLYASGDAVALSNNVCVTANYTLMPPADVAVLNCEQPDNSTQAQCVRGNATIRADAQYDSQLQVSFFEDGPPGAYNVAALLGNWNYGYFAAAVYSCFVPPFGPSTPREQWFILARTPYAPKYTFSRLAEQLKCNGYTVPPLHTFTPTAHDEKCNYQGGEGTFVVVPPTPPSFI